MVIPQPSARYRSEASEDSRDRQSGPSFGSLPIGLAGRHSKQICDYGSWTAAEPPQTCCCPAAWPWAASWPRGSPPCSHTAAPLLSGALRQEDRGPSSPRRHCRLYSPDRPPGPLEGQEMPTWGPRQVALAKSHLPGCLWAQGLLWVQAAPETQKTEGQEHMETF